MLRSVKKHKISYCKSMLQEIDIFGENFNLTFQGKQKYTTPFGGVVSIICFTCMIIFGTLRVQKLISKEDPNISMTTQARRSGPIDLYEHSYLFAVEKIDPKLGRL